MTTRIPSCDWVQSRLAMEIVPDRAEFRGRQSWLADTDEAISSTEFGIRRVEDSGFVAKDRAKLTRHLADCAACRRYQGELIEAMSALSNLSAISPVEESLPSLWPALELRIRDYERARAQRSKASSWLPAVFTFAFGRCRDLLNFECGIPVVRAWDSLTESIHGTALCCRERFSNSAFQMRPGVVLLCGFLMALLGGTIVFHVDRALTSSQLEIARGAQPIVPAVSQKSLNLTHGDLEAELDLTAENHDAGNRWLWHSSVRTFISASKGNGNATEPARSDLPGALAQAEVSSDSKPSPNSPTGSSGSRSGVSSAPAYTTSPASSRYDFDLERGTPMNPDSRGAKPAY